MLERTLRPPRPLSLWLTLGPLRRGAGDPTMRIGPSGVWRATRTPDGPAAVHLAERAGAITVRSWGPGAAWALETAPSLVGAEDHAAGFEPRHPVVVALARRQAGLRIPRTGAVAEALVPTILEQKVTGLEARRSYRALVQALGDRAPGPAGDLGLLVPPAPSTLAATPSYGFHRFGVERRRAETIRRACAAAPRLEAAAKMDPAHARRRLCAIPGVGPWSAAEVALVALGDADAVSVNDFHLPHQVAWALAGEARADDPRMLELLEPFRGHRGRVIRLIVAGGLRPPRFGPRVPVRSISRI